jgi:hypothetical protein
MQGFTQQGEHQLRFCVQEDEFPEYEQLVSYGVANIHKCQ